ncbi:MAG: type-F conjugative transfer system pilin assembly protein TrbC [Gammaproteobacteria bacterium]
MKTKSQYYAVSQWVMGLCLIVLTHGTALGSLTDYLSEAQDLVRQTQNPINTTVNIDGSNVLEQLQALVPASDQITQGPILFVSFAMPDESLQAWIAQAVFLDIPVIVRGLHQDSLLKTQQKVASLLTDEQGGLAIDPTLFKKFSITQVPTLVVANSDTDFDKVTGNVGMNTLLEMMVKHGEHSQDVARQLLDRIGTWSS